MFVEAGMSRMIGVSGVIRIRIMISGVVGMVGVLVVPWWCRKRQERTLVLAMGTRRARVRSGRSRGRRVYAVSNEA